MIHLSLPYPPSANRLWRYVNGRAIKSTEYRRWLERAAGEILIQDPASGPLLIWSAQAIDREFAPSGGSENQCPIQMSVDGPRSSCPSGGLFAGARLPTPVAPST